MTHTVEATYEDGVLKLSHPLPLKPHQKVLVTVEPQSSPLLDAYGILGYKGDHETLERFVLDAELDPQEGT